MATSTISYFRRDSGKVGGKKRATAAGQAAAQSYQATPLFFQETMEASNVSRLATNEDELSFEASASDMTTEAADGGLGDETMRSR